MNVSIETITPADAKLLLQKNTHNRNLKDSYILRLAGAIGRGEWVLNGESIKINGDVLIDGQHRLAAVVKSGVPITTLVVRDLPVAVQETVDTGSRRTISDILKLRGEKHNSLLSTSVTLLYQYRKDWFGSATRSFPTPQEALALLDKEPRIRVGLNLGDRARKRLALSSGVITFLFYVFSEIDAEDADDFFNRLVDGVDLQPGSPLLALRRAIERNREAPKNRKSYREMAALTIKAWNAYRDGTEVQLLKWNPGGAHPEPFPVPR